MIESILSRSAREMLILLSVLAICWRRASTSWEASVRGGEMEVI